MNIDTALRRREALEEMTYSEILALSYELLDEVARLRDMVPGAWMRTYDDLTHEIDRLRTALTVPPSTEPFTSPLEPDDTRYGYVPDSFVLDMPNVQLVVSRAEVRSLADWFMLAGCDIGIYLLEEIGEEP